MPVPCPLCDQFSGKPESVRAHISAKQDDRHSGESGFDYETELGLDRDSTETDTGNPVPTSSEPEPGADPGDSVEIRTIEQDETEDGKPVVKLVLAGAAIEGLSRALTGKGLVEQIGDDTGDRKRI
jgi:hypothetical protein